MLLIGKFSFDSAHFIKDSDELLTKKCAELHGHSYHGEVRIDLGLLQRHFQRKFVDFELVKRSIDNVVSKYDHKNISDLFKLHTVEDIAFALLFDFENYFCCPPNPKAIFLTLFETDKWGVQC